MGTQRDCWDWEVVFFEDSNIFDDLLILKKMAFSERISWEIEGKFMTFNPQIINDCVSMGNEK